MFTFKFTKRIDIQEVARVYINEATNEATIRLHGRPDGTLATQLGDARSINIDRVIDVLDNVAPNTIRYITCCYPSAVSQNIGDNNITVFGFWDGPTKVIGGLTNSGSLNIMTEAEGEARMSAICQAHANGGGYQSRGDLAKRGVSI